MRVLQHKYGGYCMPWVLKDKEMESVLRLDGPQRYAYFVRKICDEGRIWSLRDDEGCTLFADDSGQELVPVWPHEKFAMLCASTAGEGHYAEAIDLEAWLERWIPGMERDGRLVAVFATPQDRGVVIEPTRLDGDLRQELLKYEDEE